MSARQNSRAAHFAIALGLALGALRVPAACSREAAWSIGANAGISFIQPERGAHVTTLSAPGTVSGMQPGLRLGHTLSHPNAEAYLDGGLSWSTSNGAHDRGAMLIANVQWNFSPASSAALFVDAGFGLLSSTVSTGRSSVSGTAARAGLGAGVRRRVGDAGTVRAGARWDHDTRDMDGSIVVIPGGSVLTLRAGFDLWLR